MTALFLFAHQDDEIGVIHEIAKCASRGERAVCVYLTNGVWAGVSAETRNAESARALSRVGVRSTDIHFAGTELSIPDGKLVEHLERCLVRVLDVCADIAPITRLFVHAWEGGHHDHDAAHLVGLALAARLSLLDVTRQFPLYRMPAGRFLLTYSRPLPANGPVSRERIPVGERLRYLALLKTYRSQTRVMIKLLPHIVWEYVTDGHQKLQPVSLDRVHEPPLPGQLLYEKWNLYTRAAFEQNAAPLVAAIAPPRATGLTRGAG